MRFIYTLFLLIPCLLAQAQKFELWSQAGETSMRIGSFEEKELLTQAIRDHYISLHQSGYFMPELDTLKESETLKVRIKTGDRYQWATLSMDSIPEWINQEIKKLIPRAGDYFSQSNVDLLLDRVLEHSQNSGYPFAKTGLHDLKFEDKSINASLFYDPGPQIMIDSIDVNHALRLKKRFLYQMLDVEPGSVFSQKKINQIAHRIEKYKFIRQKGSYDLTFQDQKAIIYLNLINEKVNYIDGLAGFMMDQDQNLVFNGSLELNLENIFGTGKKIGLFWQNAGGGSQNIDLKYHHPFLLGSPIHSEMDFTLLKQDSAFLNRKLKIALGLNSTHHISYYFSFSHHASQVLNSVFADSTQENYTAQFYGVTLNWEPPLKEQEFEVSVDVQGGNRDIRRDILDTPSDQDLPGLQIITGIESRFMQPLGKLFYLQTKGKFEKLWSDDYYRNELFRLGGFRTLRGFTENYFYAASYGVLSAELGIHIDEQSSLYSFIDQGIMVYQTNDQKWNTQAHGLGLGFSIQTNNGRFNLVWAAGGTDQQKLNFRQSLLHFGYQAKF